MHKVDSTTQLMSGSERLSSLSPTPDELEKNVDVKTVGLELGPMRRSMKIGPLLISGHDEVSSSPDYDDEEDGTDHNLFAIVSYKSGGGKALTVWPLVRERLKNKGIRCGEYVLKSRGDCRRIGSSIKSPESYTGILMVGGDGIVQEFVSGAYEFRNRSNTWNLMVNGSLPLGMIPCGTDNGISKGLCMTDVDVCLDSILLKRVVSINVLRVSFTSEPVNLSSNPLSTTTTTTTTNTTSNTITTKTKSKSSDSDEDKDSDEEKTNMSSSTSSRSNKTIKERISVETSSDDHRFHVLSLCAGGFGLLGDIAAEADNLRSNPFCKCCRYEYLAVRNICCCARSRFARIRWVKPGGCSLDDPRDCNSYSGEWTNVGFGNCHGALPSERKNYNGKNTMLWINRAPRVRVPCFSGIDIVCRALCRYLCFESWAEIIETPAFELDISSNSCTMSDAVVLNVDGMPIVGSGPIRVDILSEKIVVFSGVSEDT